MKKLLVCFVFVVVGISAKAQFSRHIVQFRDKATNPFSLSNPAPYLSSRAIDRRTRYGIAIDSTDLPVTPRYIDSLRLAGAVTILNVSRWLNQVSIQTTDAAALTKINSLPFVRSVSAIAAKTSGLSGRGTKSIEINSLSNTQYPISTIQSPITNISISQYPNNLFRTTADFFSYGSSYNQVHMHNGEFLHNIGLRGQNIIIGVLDGGFFNYTNLKAFDSARLNGQILGTYDFVARETSVTEDDAHGMQCLSVIAANIPNQFVGTAPKASFYLFRSEDGASEYPIEEHNWVCATERTDSAGGDMISSSLGYSDGMSNSVFNHTYPEMDGNTTIATRGADLGAKKGMLIVNSAGNDGGGSFNYISAPADGDSVMAVGAVNAAGVSANFSSYGPSSDGQVKPDVASQGVSTVVQSTNNTIGTNNGTSFACPNIAGLAACLWQGFQEYNNIKILNALRQSGSKASAPDNRVGYGIPDVRKAVMNLLKEFSTATIAASTCKNNLSWTSKDVAAMRYEIERKLPNETVFTKIAERSGIGTSFGTATYQFGDSLVNLPVGIYSYRIRQIIDTSATGFTADYIDTVNITTSTPCIITALNLIPLPGVTSGQTAVQEFLLLPNPATEKVSIKLTTTSPIAQLTIRVTDSKGAVIATRREAKSAGTTTFHLPSHQWASGTYYVSLYKREKLMATKELIKL